VAVAGGLREDRVRRARLLRLVDERVAGGELAAAVQREDLLVAAAGAVGDAAELLERVRQVRVDQRLPARCVPENLVPREPRRLGELVAVPADRALDLLARLLAVLPTALARRSRDLDQRHAGHRYRFQGSGS
jgi:hypothetical protein